MAFSRSPRAEGIGFLLEQGFANAQHSGDNAADFCLLRQSRDLSHADKARQRGLHSSRRLSDGVRFMRDQSNALLTGGETLSDDDGNMLRGICSLAPLTVYIDLVVEQGIIDRGE
jgi:hypothetical protein